MDILFIKKIMVKSILATKIILLYLNIVCELFGQFWFK